jgi:predicted pyridoxine 5'-phosphate oxidase superfamily flavin-nucleotide-binding protein
MAMGKVHPGEEAVRERAGSGRPGIGSGQVGDTIPAVARAFVDTARLAGLAVVDSHGEISADVLAGEPGFLRALDERTVEIGIAPPLTAPLFGPGIERTVGLLVLEPWARRRMRINGTAARSGRSVVVRTDQVYGNCPKYIQERTVDAVVPPAAARSREETATAGGQPPGTGRLTRSQRELVSGADTFFLATHAHGHGGDMSHRGGNPGFVTVTGDRRLSWPDYAGNSMYMSLGNLLHEPRCALVFPDWSSGRTLHLRGRAKVDWDPRRAAGIPGAQRVIDFDLELAVEIADGMPLRWRFGSYHRFNPPTGGLPAGAGVATMT